MIEEKAKAIKNHYGYNTANFYYTAMDRDWETSPGLK